MKNQKKRRRSGWGCVTPRPDRTESGSTRADGRYLADVDWPFLQKDRWRKGGKERWKEQKKEKKKIWRRERKKLVRMPGMTSVRAATSSTGSISKADRSLLQSADRKRQKTIYIRHWTLGIQISATEVLGPESIECETCETRETRETRILSILCKLRTSTSMLFNALNTNAIPQHYKHE